MLNFDGVASQAGWVQRVNEVDAARNRIIRAANKLLAGPGEPLLREIEPPFTKQEIQSSAQSGT